MLADICGELAWEHETHDEGPLRLASVYDHTNAVMSLL